MPNTNIMSGWAQLGNALAGGGVAQGDMAEARGESLGANTINALAQARQRVTENNARDNLASSLQKLHDNPDDPEAQAGVLLSGQKLTELSSYNKGVFENRQRNIAADPNATDDARAGALFSTQSNPEVLRTGANGEFQNVLHPSQGVQYTPLGQEIAGAGIDEKKSAVTRNNAEATAANARAQASNAVTAAGGRAPPGYRWATDENGASILEAIPGGPKDPAAKAAQPMGSREAAIFQRQLNSAKQATAGVGSIMAMPAGGTTGIFGIGGSPGHSALQATGDTLRNAVSSNDTQIYNTMLPGLDRSLATIETAGMVPPGTFTNSFGNLAFREGDTEETKLHKLAEIRQVVDNGMDVAANNPRIPDDQRQYIRQIQSDIRSAIPFTHADLFQLSHDKQPGETLADVVKRRTGLASSAAPGAAPAAVPAAGGLPAGWTVKVVP